MQKPLRGLFYVGCLGLVSGTAPAQEVTLKVATVDNRDMVLMQELSDEFTASHPGISLDWVTLDEGVLRQEVTTDIATKGGRFDVVTVGTFEVPIWGERGWLTTLDDLPEDYDVDDIFASVRDGLSVDGKLHAVPFYGESAFTMYRRDLFEQAGLDMPREPTWEFIEEAARKIGELDGDAYGICLRGQPAWGENVAIISAMANAYGARWFDMDWQAQLDSDAWSQALSTYVGLLTEFGPPDPGANGYRETLELFTGGRCGIWVDATVAASTVSDPEESDVAGQVGFAMAPGTGLDKTSNWLWSWALAIPTSSTRQEAAKQFVAWATSSDYLRLVAERTTWANVPPGTRKSLYENPRYLEAAPWAELVLASIEAADPAAPSVDEVPYQGIQFVGIPEFPGIGTAVGNRFADALSGAISIEQALEDAQWVTGKVIDRAMRFSFFDESATDVDAINVD